MWWLRLIKVAGTGEKRESNSSKRVSLRHTNALALEISSNRHISSLLACSIDRRQDRETGKEKERQTDREGGGGGGGSSSSSIRTNTT